MADMPDPLSPRQSKSGMADMPDPPSPRQSESMTANMSDPLTPRQSELGKADMPDPPILRQSESGMSDLPDPPNPRQSESVINYFNQTTRNENTRRRDRTEDNEVEEDEASVIETNLLKRKKFLVSDGRLHFSTALKRLITSRETENHQAVFQFESSSEVQIENDSRATAALETETKFTRDARARHERVLKSGGDDKVYRGISAYVDHKAGFRRDQTVAGEKVGGSHGPLRASAHIRVSTRFDYQPDVCKDYKESGYCGYGDSCKYLHDRGDYKSGWQLEKEWDEKEKAIQKKLAREELGIEEDAEHCDDSLPFECSICSQAFRDPVVTKCKHYFCEQCALKHHAKNKKCFVCNAPTLGIFNTAQEIRRKLVLSR
ncbi:zinc finger CCCH domain-containing protein 1-like [Apium graveolens]|uniref:zinc finger CCCH domain-containing protein 1-like n=1 Tax=Apium graveolens TaxID=4045 RepID=UPI003D7BB097